MTTRQNIKRIAIMGSTGSIGTQTLDIIRNHPDKYYASVLTAFSNWELLTRQALEFKPQAVVIADDRFLNPLKEALGNTGIEIHAGAEALVQAASRDDVDIVVGALVGFSGLKSTIAAIKNGKQLALANKETLVVAGEIIEKLVKEAGKRIYPVDSEHSAIFQCLQGETHNHIENLILTASGGPFRNSTKEEMEKATISDALNHPNWSMGNKVTIDSASMMNKGFEMIEARWLFDVKPQNIKILVHPQSVIHSMVEFIDGSIKAQIGSPDMHIPIGYALSYPDRLVDKTGSHMKPHSLSNLTFYEPDFDRFPSLALAYHAIGEGGNCPAVLNAANEVAVKSFLSGKIGFNDMYRVVEKTINHFTTIQISDIGIIFDTHKEATLYAEDLVVSNSFK